MPTLKEAREKDKLDQFIKEHERDPEGDEATFNRAVRAIGQKSKAAPKASRSRGSAD